MAARYCARGALPAAAGCDCASWTYPEASAGCHLADAAPHDHISAPATGKTYTLLQKNKRFSPHLLIVPVGSVVHFPNADPFFHNVFSEFEGRRFDLGLYQAGSSKEITFGREGVSYIFCNIHPEMSAVVIALSTPFYSVKGPRDVFTFRTFPRMITCCMYGWRARARGHRMSPRAE